MNNKCFLAGKACLAAACLVSLLVASPAAMAAQRMLIGNTTNAALDQRQDSDTVQTIGALRSQVADKGTTRIIVGVRVPFAAEGDLSQADAALQRNEIASTNSRLLDRLPAFKQKSKTAKQFESIPFMAMEVTAAELEVLLASTDVTTIEEDRLNQLHLAESVPIIGGTSAWSSGYTGVGQTVAILDTGVDKNHPFLTGRVVSEACYSTTYAPDSATSICPGGVAASTAANSAMPYTSGVCPSGECDHGTHVAGIAAGSGASAGQSFSGVAKGASIIAIQVFSRFNNLADCGNYAPCALAYTSDMIAGMQRVYALSGTYSIASVNMSIGGGSYSSQATCDANNASRKAIIDTLRSVNIATVISSGNDGYTSSMGAPGCISSAVSVGSTWDSSSPGRACPLGGIDYGGVDNVACYSNSASFLNLLAPGSAIYSSTPYSTYATYHGTSMAAPHVAGAWALLKQEKPSITVTEALAALSNTGQPVTDARNGISKPRINVNAALASIQIAPSVFSLSVSKVGSGTVTSSPVGISCGSTCSANFSSGTNVVLTATPDTGYSFASWGGACSGTASPCTVTMNAAKTVSASFSAIGNTVTALNQTGLAGASGSDQYFTVTVPTGASNLVIQTSGGTGDMDLYVRAGSNPTLSAYDCRPFVGGNTEICTIPSPLAGTYYIMLHGYSTYAGVSLTATYVGVPSTAPAVSLNPTSLTFTNQAVGTTSAAKTATLTNTGNATLTITNIVRNNAVFNLTNNCASTLAAGANCTFGVSYTPTSAVNTVSSVTVTSNAPGSPHSVVLNGTGIGVPVCTLIASPPRVPASGTSVLTSSCTNSPTSYSWTGGTCAGTTGSTCTVTPATTTTYTVTGTNAAGSGTASATVTIGVVDLTPILFLLLI